MEKKARETIKKNAVECYDCKHATRQISEYAVFCEILGHGRARKGLRICDNHETK